MPGLSSAAAQRYIAQLQRALSHPLRRGWRPSHRRLKLSSAHPAQLCHAVVSIAIKSTGFGAQQAWGRVPLLIPECTTWGWVFNLPIKPQFAQKRHILCP